MSKHSFTGHHAFLDAVGIYSMSSIPSAMKMALKISGATVENVSTKKFDSGGMSIIYTLSESHFTSHTYPECYSAFFDFFTCGRACDPYNALLELKRLLQCKGRVKLVSRGEL